MDRREFSRDERRRYAKEASRRGDASVARRVGRKKETVAAWRTEFSLPVANSKRTRRAKQAQTPPLAKTEEPALNSVLDAETGLLGAVSDLSLDQSQELADRSEFSLGPKDWKQWTALEGQPARDLPELRELMAWRSPHIAYDEPKPGKAAS